MYKICICWLTLKVCYIIVPSMVLKATSNRLNIKRLKFIYKVEPDTIGTLPTIHLMSQTEMIVSHSTNLYGCLVHILILLQVPKWCPSNVTVLLE